MIDLTAVQLVKAVPGEIIALQTANKTLLSQNQSLGKSNKTLTYVGIGLFITAVFVGAVLLHQHYKKKEEEIDSRTPAAKP